MILRKGEVQIGNSGQEVIRARKRGAPRRSRESPQASSCTQKSLGQRGKSVLVAMLALAGLASGQFMCTAAPLGLTLQWENNILTIHSPRMPGRELKVQYLELFCRRGSSRGSTQQEWTKSVIPHHTWIVHSRDDGSALELESRVGGTVRVRHEISVVADGVDFRLTLENLGGEPVDIEWGQPCVQVDRFTGLGQEHYVQRCFLFTERGLTMLNQTRRTEEALFRGGQVYVPAGINPEDVNPRPISPDVPTKRLIGCFSEDGKYLVATAWEPTQNLFQGIFVCIHNDFGIHGLTGHEIKHVRGKLYFMENDLDRLLRHYREDFGDDGP